MTCADCPASAPPVLPYACACVSHLPSLGCSSPVWDASLPYLCPVLTAFKATLCQCPQDLLDRSRTRGSFSRAAARPTRELPDISRIGFSKIEVEAMSSADFHCPSLAQEGPSASAQTPVAESAGVREQSSANELEDITRGCRQSGDGARLLAGAKAELRI